LSKYYKRLINVFIKALISRVYVNLINVFTNYDLAWFLRMTLWHTILAGILKIFSKPKIGTGYTVSY